MKKIVLSFLLIVTAFGSLLAQKVINDANAEKRNTGSFHGVEIGGGIDLYISEGDEAVAVSASEIKHRDRIRTEVKNGILKIWYDYKNGFNFETSAKRMKAYVSYKTLDRLGASGGSDVFVDGAIKTSKLDLDVSGGSDFHGKVEIGGSLSVDASGGSDVHISGTAANLVLEASGGSDFKGYDLAVDVCDLNASGGSDITITVNKEMTAEASGGSDIHYKGNGLIRNVSSSGSSDIKKVSK